MKILLIEDDLALGQSLQEYLQSKGYTIIWLDNELDLEEIYLNEFSVIILDLILRQTRGEDLLQSLRSRGCDIPVLILTAKTRLTDKKTCFDLGADDYLTKPFDPLELLLRIRALCRREYKESLVKIGNVEVDLASGLLLQEGREIRLSRKAWDLLLLLLRNRGSVVSKDDILNSVWSEVLVTNDVVRYYIKEIRKILPRDSIETYKGRGYKLR